MKTIDDFPSYSDYLSEYHRTRDEMKDDCWAIFRYCYENEINQAYLNLTLYLRVWFEKELKWAQEQGTPFMVENAECVLKVINACETRMMKRHAKWEKEWRDD